MNRRLSLIAIIVILAMILSLTRVRAHTETTIIYVGGSGGFGSCDSWANGCNLRYALENASSGTEIWVAEGVHVLSMVSMNPGQTYQLKNGVALYGGFVGTETDRSQRDPQMHLTVLSGFVCEDILGVLLPNNVYHVVTAIGTDASAVLDGFLISLGIAQGPPPHDYGAGMLNLNSSPTLSNITFVNNVANGGGGGMYNVASSPILNNVTFLSNYAASGGGMYNVGSNPVLNTVTFITNGATDGGGMYNSNSNPIMNNVTFINNTADDSGGGVLNASGNPEINNVTFTGNTATTGGAIANLAGSSSIHNSILWGNTATTGPQIHIVGGTPSISYSVVQDGCPAGADCSNTISADPLLGPIGTYGGNTQIYSLLPGSSAIDSADTTNCPASDQRGIARPQGSDCDMGSFESRGFNLAVSGGDPQSAIRSTAFDLPLEVSVNSAYGEPVEGGRISYVAPASGASAVIAGSPAAILDGGTSVTATANNNIGTYTVAAEASGVSTPALFHLTNRNSIIYYVTETGITSGECGTWESACNLQYALDTAYAGVEVWVAAGTYVPIAEFARFATFQLKNGVELYGGFAGNEESRKSRNPVVNETILSGEIGTTSNTDNIFHVVTGSGTDASAVLDGFTILRGYANGGSPNDQGGGIYNFNGSPQLRNITFTRNTAVYGAGMYNSNNSNPILNDILINDNFATSQGGGIYNSTSSSPFLHRVTFDDNSSGSLGGGMYNDDSSNPIIRDCMFSHNSAVNGGGIYNSSSQPNLTTVDFTSNTADTAGGGMFNTANSNPTLDRITFTGNTALSGGGVYNDNSSPMLTNITFSANTASLYGGGMNNSTNSNPELRNVTFSANSSTSGGGIYNSNNSSPALTNITFSDNSATSKGGGIYNDSSSPIISNSILWDNTAGSGSQLYNSSSSPTVAYSVVAGGCPAGTTCTNLLSADPLLGALGNTYGGEMQVFPLLPGSSAIDAGEGASCATSDQRGVVRPQGMYCDVGAFESHGFTMTITSGDNQIALINTAFAQPLTLKVSSAYGEPISNGIIGFDVPESGAGAILTSSLVVIEVDTVSVGAMANGIPGSYNVSASAAGKTIPLTFHLTNFVYQRYLPLTIK